MQRYGIEKKKTKPLHRPGYVYMAPGAGELHKHDAVKIKGMVLIQVFKDKSIFSIFFFESW